MSKCLIQGEVNNYSLEFVSICNKLGGHKVIEIVKKNLRNVFFRTTTVTQNLIPKTVLLFLIRPEEALSQYAKEGSHFFLMRTVTHIN